MLSCFTQTFSQRFTEPSKGISYTVGVYPQKGFAISLYIKECSQIPPTALKKKMSGEIFSL